MIERGPLRARVAIDRTYSWPERVFFGERSGERETRTTTTLEVRVGSPLVHITTEIDNPCAITECGCGSRSPEPADGSTAECAFAVVDRGLVAEGGPNEVGYPIFPSRRFVCAGGLTVLHEGLLEYELVDIDDDRRGRTRTHVVALHGAALERTDDVASAPGRPVRPLSTARRWSVGTRSATR